MHTHSFATAKINTVERTWQPVRELVAAWLRKSPVAVAAQALPLRLRQSAVRTELLVKDLPGMITPIRQGASRETANPSLRNAGVTPSWTTVLQKQSPAPAPAVNIEALTTQVMQQIDRRLVAWRERMGRV